MSDWSDATLERAREIIARYPQKRSAVMPLLYLAMAEEGWLTDEGIEQVGLLVDMTPAQVQAVASFYTMYKRERTGRYLVSVCTSISCMLLDADDVLHAIEDESGVPSGETDEEGVISVEHAECIGACGGAPALQVNYETIEGVTADKGRELIRWLRSTTPAVIDPDELQELHGGRRSFDWAIHSGEGAIGPYPAFGPLGTAKREGGQS